MPSDRWTTNLNYHIGLDNTEVLGYNQSFVWLLNQGYNGNYGFSFDFTIKNIQMPYESNNIQLWLYRKEADCAESYISLENARGKLARIN